uniref:agouti-related protein isoform X1 n=2 Tax=Podarcis muralis TaxID=64176 RepID=UPI00109F3866|nr:agouti-related protein isoform X1 [Podarcis muralis]
MERPPERLVVFVVTCVIPNLGHLSAQHLSPLPPPHHLFLAWFSRETMLRILLLSLGLLQEIPTTLASNPNHSRRLAERGPSMLDEEGRSSYPGLLQVIKEGPPDFEHLAALEMPIAQDDLVLEANAMEPQQMLLTALQTQGREERSPRRCVRLQESCLGHKLPCCDPCATCYCRFFNANCFCKKFSNTFPCGKN